LREIILVEMSGLPMTGEAYIGATPPVTPPPGREAAPALPAQPGSDAAPKAAAPVASSAPTAPSPSFPLTLQFDQETHRFIIEARDASGMVVFQLPFKSAARATNDAASSSEARGQHINSKA